MTIHEKHDVLIIQFEDKDWRYNTVGVQNVIRRIKSLGHVNKNPDGFIYDTVNREWVLKLTQENVKFAEQLKEELNL